MVGVLDSECGGGAVQRDPDDARHPGLGRLRLHGGQRGHQRHLPRSAERGEADLRPPQHHHRPGRILHHRQSALPGKATRDRGLPDCRGCPK